MAGRIPREFIDELISRVDIVELIDSRVPLKKAGREYTACCPFHSEKTPSFTVSPTKQFYHCFGCGAHGTALGFLLEYEHLDFVEAVTQLADRVGMEVPREAAELSNRPSSQPLYDILGQSSRFFRKQLKGPHGPRAVEYLKGRGLSGEIAAEYGIGYAPPGWDNLLKALGGDPEMRRNLIITGMAVEKEERAYDRFRNRVMFPIRDARGRTIAFGGRVIDDDTPKYLNSPETPIFHKGRELYGLYEARQALRAIPRLLVVEGYMDVVALAQFGIRYAVATLGTSVTTDHVEKLFRVSDEVVFCFDGDRAGRDAAWRGLENALPQLRDGRQLRFMFLPEGDDPDTMVRRVGRESFEQALVDAKPLSEFFFDQLSTQADLSSLDGRARLAELAKPYLTKLPSGTFRQLMVERLAALAGTDPVRIESVLFGKRPPLEPKPSRPTLPAPGSSKTAPSLAQRAIAMLLHWPRLGRECTPPPGLAGQSVPGTRLLAEMLELLTNHPHLTTAGLVEHWRDAPEGRHLATLARREPLLGEEADLAVEFRDALQKLERLGRTERRRELEGRFRELTPEERLEYQRLLADKNER